MTCFALCLQSKQDSIQTFKPKPGGGYAAAHKNKTMTKIFFAQTYLGKSTSFPGTSDNPMRPELCIHPITGEEHQAHYNSKNLSSDKDYEDAGFEHFPGRGWCYPVKVEVPEDQASLNGIILH